jgi:hypothetical protein
VFALKILAAPGQRFGRLVVLREVAHPYYECKCDCGSVVTRNVRNFRRARASLSCGCYRIQKKTTHGHAHGHIKTKTYMSWTNMKTRCMNPQCDRFDYYGGRGITVCPRWLAFHNFLADMGECPIGMQLERIDNNHGYSKENCVWASRQQQALNRRSNRLLEFNGEKLHITIWSKKLGLRTNTIRDRLKRGWPMHRVLTLKGTKPRVTPKRVRAEPGQAT